MTPLFEIDKEGLHIRGTPSADAMKLFIDATLVPPKKVIGKELLEIISQHVPPDLISIDVLNDVAHHLNRGEEVKERRVAKGMPPEDGADGKIIFLARRVRTKAGKISVKDHGAQLDLEKIVTNRPLARLYKPKAGVTGMSVLGKPLPPKPGRPIEFKMNPTITIERPDDGFDVIMSAKEGFLGEENGELSVLDEMVFDGDFDHRLGVIDFSGNVKITGDVKNDSSITARGAIEVRGGVLPGTYLRSVGSNILVQGAVNGGKTSKFLAGGDLDCHIIQQVDIEAHGNLKVRKEAHACQMRTQGFLDARGAHLFGVVAFSTLGVVVGKLGNTAGVVTEINLCSEVETQKEYRDLLQKIESHEKAAELIELHLGPFVTNPGRVVNLDRAHRKRIEDLLKKHRDVKNSHQTLVEKKEEMLKASVMKEEVMISVEKVMYSGVVIKAGLISFTSYDEQEGPFTLVLKKGAEAFEKIPFVTLIEDEKDKKGVKK